MGPYVDDSVTGLLTAGGVGVGEMVEHALTEGAHADARSEAPPQ